MSETATPAFNEKWDRRFLALAKEVSTWSKDPGTQVGAVIVSPDHRIVSIGYNGLPQKIEDSDETLNNRDLKLQVVLHAEENSVLNCLDRSSLRGATVYTYPMPPCAHCSSVLIQAGIIQVVSLADFAERWKDSVKISFSQFQQANIQVTLY